MGPRQQGVGFVRGHHPLPQPNGKTAFLLSLPDPSLGWACPPSDFSSAGKGCQSEIGGPLYQEPVMAIAVQTKPLDLTPRHADFHRATSGQELRLGRLPREPRLSRLARAQMRYIGAGGSPKADDPSTLKPGQFTLSLVYQPVGKYAACHSHEVGRTLPGPRGRAHRWLGLGRRGDRGSLRSQGYRAEPSRPATAFATTGSSRF